MSLWATKTRRQKYFNLTLKKLFQNRLVKYCQSGYGPEKGITYDIEMKKGSSLLENLHEIQYIKMDIEGYEKLFFRNWKESLKISTHRSGGNLGRKPG